LCDLAALPKRVDDVTNSRSDRRGLRDAHVGEALEVDCIAEEFQKGVAGKVAASIASPDGMGIRGMGIWKDPGRSPRLRMSIP